MIGSRQANVQTYAAGAREPPNTSEIVWRFSRCGSCLNANIPVTSAHQEERCIVIGGCKDSRVESGR